jgi:tRNA (mo5U34)-methyltransferase
MISSSPQHSQLLSAVQKIRWWHRIDLGNGIITPGHRDVEKHSSRVGMPQDLRGLTVLDVGAFDGGFSFEAERRGACRVVALDSFGWDKNGPWSKAGFELARAARHSHVEDVEMEVLDISPERLGQFDLVLFLGVLYHLPHPLLALERLFSVTKRQLIMETHVDMTNFRRPVMVFYPGAELNNDPTNWWGPNPLAVVAMLRSVGFTRIEIIHRPSLLGRLFNGLEHQFIPPTRSRLVESEQHPTTVPLLHSLRQGRMVVHAWR